MLNSNPLAEANGNKKNKKAEMKVVMESIYCRRFQPTDKSNKQQLGFSHIF